MDKTAHDCLGVTVEVAAGPGSGAAGADGPRSDPGPSGTTITVARAASWASGPGGAGRTDGDLSQLNRAKARRRLMPNLAQPPASLTTLIMAHGSEGVSCVGSIVKVLYRSGPRHRARRPGGHDGPPADPALTAGPQAAPPPHSGPHLFRTCVRQILST